jgi:hypothetical protein
MKKENKARMEWLTYPSTRVQLTVPMRHKWWYDDVKLKIASIGYAHLGKRMFLPIIHILHPIQLPLIINPKVFYTGCPLPLSVLVISFLELRRVVECLLYCECCYSYFFQQPQPHLGLVVQPLPQWQGVLPSLWETIIRYMIIPLLWLFCRWAGCLDCRTTQSTHTHTQTHAHSHVFPN